MAAPKNDETTFTNWPKVSTLTVFCPETTCATIGLSETCRIVLPDLQKREGNQQFGISVCDQRNQHGCGRDSHREQDRVSPTEPAHGDSGRDRTECEP